MNRMIGMCARALKTVVGVLLVGALLTGCSTFDNPLDDLEAPSLPSLPNPKKWFAEEKEKLKGERIAVIQPQERVSATPTAAFAPVVLPAPSLNPAWTQPGGVASNAPGHLALNGGLQVRWSANAGKGSSSKGKLTVSPIIAEGKVFTLDTRGRVSAFSTGAGSTLWSGKLTPESESDYEGFGGGLAFDGGQLFAATGYGTVSSINPANGSLYWTVNLGAPIRSSITASGGKVFVVTKEGKLFCLAAVDGQQLWKYRALPESTALLTNVSPAVYEDIVVVPYPSGDIVAFDIASGKPKWSESLARRRSAASSMASLTNPARPVVYQGTVYAVGHSGRMIASSVKTGERFWNQNVQALQMPAVAGDSVFVVDINGSLMAFGRKDGKSRWMSKLPEAKSWQGPILANGLLWLVSSKGQVVGVDATNGKVVTDKNIGTRVHIAPVVANGKMYVLSDKGTLYAVN